MKTKLFAALCLAVPLQGMALDSYFIGNSLTWDSQPNGLAALAQQSGLELNVGYHIRAGQPLVYTANNPDDITMTNGYGGYATALANHAWDVVTIQPYFGPGSTQATDLAAIDQFIDMTRAGPSTSTAFYIYAGWPAVSSWAWPPQPSDSYLNSWTYQTADDPNQPTYQVAKYFDDLYTHATAQHSDQSIYLIPVGQVLARVEEEILAGNITGFDSVYDFYRDAVHMRYDIGRFIAAVTTYATLFGQSPVGLEVPDGFYNVGEWPNETPGFLTIDIALRNQLEQIAWDVVSSDARTGVVPLPGALWLLGSGLLGLGALARRRKSY